ncbi:MAG: BPSL0067 family protein [Pseudomonadota bacterium]
MNWIAKTWLLLALLGGGATTLTAQASAHLSDGASEQVYDGLLPTESEKIVMPVVRNKRGRSECVQLLKSLMDAPRTLLWREGRKLKASWEEVKPGTAIATFKQGRYPQKSRSRGSKHAAIFLRASDAGIYVFDQFAGQREAAERFIPWHHPRDRQPSNNASAYSTVRW